MKQGTKDAVKGGFIVFILFDLPLFFIGFFSNTTILINFDFTTITPYIYFLLPVIGAMIFFIGGKIKGKDRGRSIFVSKGPPVLVLDDLLATGGTALAACRLEEKAGGSVSGVAFVIELTGSLHGREKLESYDVFSLVKIPVEGWLFNCGSFPSTSWILLKMESPRERI